MIEVLWHGRGGQGAFTAARLLGAASSFADGSYALAFPSFGPERRGAPMRAFTKMSREPIGDRSAVNRANYVIYLDDTLLGAGWEDELLPGGKVIVNSVRSFDDPRIVSIDANGISQEILGRPIPNTALLGALCSVCDYVSADDVKRAIEGYMPAKLHEKNKRVVDAALVHDAHLAIDHAAKAELLGRRASSARGGDVRHAGDAGCKRVQAAQNGGVVPVGHFHLRGEGGDGSEPGDVGYVVHDAPHDRVLHMSVEID